MSKKYYPDSMAYKIALEFAKEAVGTDVRFFPNIRVMETTWCIHADKISEAMELAYLIGAGYSKSNLVLVGESYSCDECLGMLYHHPVCKALKLEEV